MININHLYGEIFLFSGFILYFIYNIYASRELISNRIQQIVINKSFSSIRFDFKNFINNGILDVKEDFSLIKDLGIEAFLNKYFFKFKFFSYLKVYISEKNSLFYIGWVCFFSIFFFVYDIFIFQSNPLFPHNNNDRILLFAETYVVDAYGLFMKIIICLLGFFFFVICQHVSNTWKFYKPEVGFFIFMGLFSMLILVSSNDFFLTFIALEIQTASIVILVAFQITNKRSIEAALKYFLYSAYFGSIFLYMVGLVYLIYGSIFFENLYILTLGGNFYSNPMNIPIHFIILLMSLYFFFKLGLFPYQYWMTDLYEGSNLLITTFLAVLSKVGLVGFFIRAYMNVFINFYPVWGPYFYYITLITMIYGSIAALFQTDLKRFLAYTSISNMGYLMSAFSTGHESTFVYGLFFMLAYFFGTFSLFFVFIGLNYKEKEKENEEFSNIESKQIINLRDLNGLFRTNKILSISLLLLLFNLIGIPPLTFFIAKYFLAVDFLILDLRSGLLIYILVNIISAFYYLRLAKIIFFDRSVKAKTFFFSSTKLSIMFYFFILIHIILAIDPTLLAPLIEFLQVIVKKLFFVPDMPPFQPPKIPFN